MITQLGIAGLLGAFALCALVIVICGIRLIAVADMLADRGGFGEALTGGVLLGAVTSLSGSVLSVSAALEGNADLALSNAYGGIAAQTVFLTAADFSYRRINLEHAAASAENIMQGVLLICLLAILLAANFSPNLSFWGIHPATVLLLVGYGYGIHLVHRCRNQPMWHPEPTRETRQDVPATGNEKKSLATLLTGFLLLGSILALSGWFMQVVASALIERSGINAVIMGTLFTATATSLPELVTTIAAVRRGALTLAFSGIIGGNAYDSLFAAFSDIAYREGSIYHTADTQLQFWLAISVLMTAVLVMGMLVREKRGIANIGFESCLVLLIYLCGVSFLILK